jgi:hypothetical protein
LDFLFELMFFYRVGVLMDYGRFARKITSFWEKKYGAGFLENGP